MSSKGGRAPRIHPVSRFLTARADPNSGERDIRISTRRDLGAALDIVPPLLELGFEYGEPILDCPPEYEVPDRYNEPLFAVELDFAQPGDYLLETTRPPMDDLAKGGRKKVELSYTDLEQKLFRVWRNYFSSCFRSEIELADWVQPKLKHPHDDRRHMQFRESEGAPYYALNACAGGGLRTTKEATERRTAAFFLRQDEAWEGGPGLISAFGMDGTATAVWAYRLGRDMRELLEKPGFVMAELTNTSVPTRPTNMLWAREWKIEILLRTDAV